MAGGIGSRFLAYVNTWLSKAVCGCYGCGVISLIQLSVDRLKPFHYYARNRILLCNTSGELAGLEDYAIRFDCDCRLVIDVGGISVAILGVHGEHLEEVRREKVTQAEGIRYTSITCKSAMPLLTAISSR